MRAVRALCCSVVVLFCCTTGFGAAGPASQVVLLSDIHLNPFPPADKCATADGKAVMAKLLAAPADQWTADDFRLQRPTTAGQDSAYALLLQALKAAHAASSDAKLVVVTGDFLEHGFRDDLKNCAPGATDTQLTSLSVSTIDFIVRQVQAAFPQAEIVPVLGNNDTDGHDYQLASGAFLSALGHAWQQELTRKDKHLRPDFAAFAKGGYYEVPLAGWKHVRLIALNSTLWSYKFSAANPYADGDAELEWLQSQLSAAYLAGDKVVLLGHIPPGLDAYATRMAHGTRVVTMYRECGDGKSQGGCRDYARAVPAMVQRFHSTIAMGIFGHTHQNEFRVAGEGSSATPLMVVPSISPIFGNNPAFLIVTADAGFHWTDYHAWALPMSQGKQDWSLEYGFDQAYAQPAWNADALLAVTRMLKSQKAARDGFFTRMASGSPSATVPSHWQDAYVCGLNHLTPETVLPCVAESQLDLPLP